MSTPAPYSFSNTIIEFGNIKDNETVFVTIGDLGSGQSKIASALEQSGYAAISISWLDQPYVPEDYYKKNTGKSFVIAFDNNSYSYQDIKNNIECFKSLGIENYKVALPPPGVTWDDLSTRGQLTPDTIKETLDKAYLQGELFFAESALDYFNHYRKQRPNTTTLIFEFDSSMFKGYLRKSKASSDVEAEVELLADCLIQLRYSVMNDSQNDKRKIEHYLEIYSKREHRDNIKLTATELTQLGAFKIALQNNRQVFYGNSRDLTNLTHYLFEPQPPKVRALSTIGYDDKTQGYYFPEFMYDQHGKQIYANGNKYFTYANIKPFMNCCDTVIIKSILDAPFDIPQFINLLYRAYSNKGLLALGFYVSSLFSHIVFKRSGFFPFLSLYGDPHTGKSFISKLLNRCFFIDSEGQTITASNTVKDHLIKISQKSNLVCALLEGGKNSRFDYDGILTLYNRNPLYSPAPDSSNSRAHDLHLKATLSFVWNHEHFTTQAAKERVISLHFANTDINESTREAWARLNNYKPEQLATVGHQLLSNRKFFEDKLIGTIGYYANELHNNGVTVPRIIANYSIALGGIIGLLTLLRINSKYYDNLLIRYTIECAKHKQLETSKAELHFANYFLESIRNFNHNQGVAIYNNETVIHLPTALNSLKQIGNDFDKNKKELIAELKKHERFIAVKSTRCFGKPCDAYHFKFKSILVNY